MLKKKFRLREREVKRVLQKWEPFFSYDVVLNTKRNNFNYNRFAIVISSKSVYSNVERNFFRRRFSTITKNIADIINATTVNKFPIIAFFWFFSSDTFFNISSSFTLIQWITCFSLTNQWANVCTKQHEKTETKKLQSMNNTIFCK